MKTFLACFISAFFVFFSFAPAWAQEFEYKDYTVQKGDTLWDITGGELKDSFQWPLLWKENPDVKNPDRIYPGQKLKIPVGRKAQEEAPLEMGAEKKGEAVVIPKAEAPKPEVMKPEKPVAVRIEPKKKSYIVTRGAMLYAGYITNSVPDEGKIIGAPTERKYFAHEDEVYINAAGGAKDGERFFVIRKKSEVFHPKNKKVRLGWLVEIIGSIEVVRTTEDGVLARVKEALSEVTVGDRLDKFYDIELPYVIDEPRKPEVGGYIVLAKDMKAISGQTDIVHIDKGSSDGLEPGDVLKAIVPGTKERRNGVLQIIATREHTATAVIIKSTDALKAGDEFSALR